MLAPVLISLALSTLGPEVPIGSLQMGPAALDQTLNSVASNGHDYLALWNDNRSSFYNAYYAGHLDANGHPILATGRKVVVAPSGGRLTWTGDSYLLIDQINGGFEMQTLDDDGKAVGPPVAITLESTPREIAANANSILVVHLDGGVWLLGRDGTPLSKSFIGFPDDVSPIFFLPNGDYAFVSRANTTLRLNVVSATTHLLQQISLGDLGSPYLVNAAASGDGRILVTWLATNSGDQANVMYEIFDAAGQVLAAPATAGSIPSATAGDISAGWDGSEFLISAGAQPLRGWRVSRSGQLAAGQPVIVAEKGRSARFARSASGVLMAWSSFEALDWDVYSRTAGSFASLPSAPTEILAVSMRWQQAPRLAAGPTPLAVFSTFNDALRAGVPGSGSDTVLEPAHSTKATVARGRSSFLTAWIATDPAAATIRVKRVAFDGTPIDAEPHIVASEFVPGPEPLYPAPPSIAFDGTNFLIVWKLFNGDLHGVRVSPSGEPLDAQPIVIATDTAAIASSVVWSGSAYVVAWIDQRQSPAGITPPIPVPAKLTVTRVGANGHLLDASPRVVWQETPASYLGLASNGNELFVLFNSNTCLTALTLNNDGTLRDAARTIDCSHGFIDIDAAWDGREFAGVWSDASTHTIYARRFDAALHALDAEPLAVNPAGSVASQPAIAATDGGATIAYIRFTDDEPQFGGVARAFTRLLPRLGPLPPRLRPSRF